MKFVLISILAIVASAVAVEGRRRLDPAEALRIRWNMDEPNVTYVSDNNTFILDFGTSSVANNASAGGFAEEFYDYNCQDDGSGFDEFIIPSGGITGPDGISPPAMQNGPDGKPQLIFRINTQFLSQLPEIYSIVNASMVGTNTIPGENRRLVEDSNNTCSVQDDPIQIINTPTATPTDAPFATPTATPTDTPFATPTATPTDTPFAAPTATPTDTPFATPTATPTDASSTCSCPVNDPSIQSWKCGNNIYVCPGVTQICSVQPSQNSVYYSITQQQCNDMRAIAIDQKCIALPQYGLVANNQRKALSNRVCYGSNPNGFKVDDNSCDACNNLMQPNVWQTPTPTAAPAPVFECTLTALQSAGKITSWVPGQVQGMIVGGCGPGVPFGFYPDLTRWDAYCKCTGSISPSSYQTNPNHYWDIWAQVTNSWISGSNANGVPYGNNGLYGTDGGAFMQYFDLAGFPTISVSPLGRQRPPYRRKLQEDSAAKDAYKDNTSEIVKGGISEDETSRNLYEFTPDDIGKGVMKICVRTSLGYTSNNIFQEVNFIESLITIFYDLTAGFCITAFNVDPKERLETTVAKETYELEAWLCDRSLPYQARTNPDRTLPAPIPTTYLASQSTPATATYFNQGALITVCIAPDNLAYSDGIRMDGINSFYWKRSDYNIQQEAIVAGSPAGNYLTSYDTVSCLGGAEYCHFSSILFADFYINTGVVGGEGDASLMFARRRNRRLGGDQEEDDTFEEAFNRELQATETSSFDLEVGVVGTEYGPGALRTAGGPSSFGTTASIFRFIAILGASALLL